MNELRPGIWHWSARHPEWDEEDDNEKRSWGPEVTSYALDLGERLVLIDPVIPATGLDRLLDGRAAVTVLTCPWHVRDALEIGLPIHAPPPDPLDTDPVPSQHFSAGDTLDLGIAVYAGLETIDLVLWVESHRALVFGDTLIDNGGGLELPDEWGPKNVSHPGVLASLRELLTLPIELALPTHGPPTDRAAFERAIAA